VRFGRFTKLRRLSTQRRLSVCRGLFRRRREELSEPPPIPLYRVRAEPGGILHFAARGDHPRVTQAFLDVVRSLSGRPGVVLVEYGERPTEWVASEVAPSALLAAMVSVRDLLGRGAVDVAVHSRNEGIEVFIDHLGELDVRSGSWNERRFRDVFARLSFFATEDPLPPCAGVGEALPPESDGQSRLAAAVETLGLVPVEDRAASGP
jgi:hypothetical protein